MVGAAFAGQIEAPVSGQNRPGGQTGAIGSTLGAPVPIQLTVPSLSAAVAPTLAPALSPVPAAVSPAALKPAALAPAVDSPKANRPVPVLPGSAVTAARPQALDGGVQAAPSAEVEPGADPGRALFDQGGARGEGAPTVLEPLRSVSRGASRSEGWVVNGRPARRLSAGGFKEVLIHPADASLVIKLFALTGANDPAGSLAEKRRELRNMDPLLKIGRAPGVVEQGALEFQTPASAKKPTGYIVQERVDGRELGEMLADPDAAVRARALKEARALFEDLIAARIKLEDRVKMHENISVGRAGGSRTEKAWVLDAGEATVVAERSVMDKLLGRPDPLRAYYESVLAALSRRARI